MWAQRMRTWPLSSIQTVHGPHRPVTWRAPPIPAFLCPSPPHGLSLRSPLCSLDSTSHPGFLHVLVPSPAPRSLWGRAFRAARPRPRWHLPGEAPPLVASSRRALTAQQAACFFVFAPSDFISVQGVIFVSFFLKWTSPTRDWGHTAVREVALLWWGSVFWGRPPHWHPDRQSGGRRGGCDSCPRPVRRRRRGGGPSPGVQGGFGRREGDPPAGGTTPEKGVSLP